MTYRCGHNDFPPDWRRYWDDVERFLSEARVLGDVVDLLVAIATRTCAP